MYPGNHDIKLMRNLRGKDVQITHGLAESLHAIRDGIAEFRGFSQWQRSLSTELVSHYVLDEGKLVVAHAGMKESMQGRGSGKVRDFALFGETTGETDDSDFQCATTGRRNIAERRWSFMDIRLCLSRNG